MDYQNHYDTLINRANCRIPEPDQYYEKHHIIPRCMGGDNKASNIAKLTGREHYIAHQLLVKIYPTNYSLVKAAMRMTTFNNHQSSNRSHNRLYEWLRRRLSVAMSNSQAGSGNSQFGKIWIMHIENQKKQKNQSIEYR